MINQTVDPACDILSFTTRQRRLKTFDLANLKKAFE